MAPSGRPLRLLLRLAGAAAAVVVFFAVEALLPRSPSLGLTPEEAVAAWNVAAGPDLRIDRLEWTEPESGTFGFAFTPTVSVIGRTAGPEVVELVVVGNRTDADLVAEAAAVLVDVVAPGTARKTDVLTRLGIDGAYVPAQMEGTAVVDGVRLRSTSAADRLGVGASPAG